VLCLFVCFFCVWCVFAVMFFMCSCEVYGSNFLVYVFKCERLRCACVYCGVCNFCVFLCVVCNLIAFSLLCVFV